jgi:predicted transcriptional regulator
MSTISLRLPESLHEHLRELAKRENVSMNQLITLALAEKVSALAAADYIQQRAAQGSRDKFEQAMAKVADVEPFAHDGLQKAQVATPQRLAAAHSERPNPARRRYHPGPR